MARGTSSGGRRRQLAGALGTALDRMGHRVGPGRQAAHRRRQLRNKWSWGRKARSPPQVCPASAVPPANAASYMCPRAPALPGCPALLQRRSVLSWSSRTTSVTCPVSTQHPHWFRAASGHPWWSRGQHTPQHDVEPAEHQWAQHWTARPASAPAGNTQQIKIVQPCSGEAATTEQQLGLLWQA